MGTRAHRVLLQALTKEAKALLDLSRQCFEIVNDLKRARTLGQLDPLVARELENVHRQHCEITGVSRSGADDAAELDPA